MKIQIYEHIFDLDINEQGIVENSTFTVEGISPASITDEQIRQGQQYTQEIFAGKWDWLIQKEGEIKIPTHDIVVNVTNPQYRGFYRFGGGSIDSNLKMVCEHCGDSNCDFDCPDALNWASSQDLEDQQSNMAELAGHKSYNDVIDGLLSMILSHAIAGLPVESAMYLEGIETALDAVGNNL